ncbi:MAG: hypothetical protein H7831_14760 [Magnetococcus sp. WYHC-3]
MTTDDKKTSPARSRDPWVRWLLAFTILVLVLTVVIRCWPVKDVPLPSRLPEPTPVVVTNIAAVAPVQVPTPVATQTTSRTVAVSDTIPLRNRVSPMLANFVDRECKTRVTADFAARVERVQTPEDLAAVVAILKDTTDGDTVRHEAASLLARSEYPKLIDDLVAILMNPAEEPRFRGFCVQHLWLNHAAADAEQKMLVETVLQERLGDPDVTVQREALLALVRLGHPEGKRMAAQWFSDPAAEDKRDLAIRCMALLNMRERIPEIRGYLRATNVAVRLAAIAALSDWGDMESRGAFEEAANSAQERLQHAGKLALMKLDHLAATNAPAANDR